MSFTDIFVAVVSVIAIVLSLLEVSKIDQRRGNSRTAMEEALEDYFSQIGDIDYYTIENLSSFSRIGNEETYIIKKDGQLFVKLLSMDYHPTIHTILKQVKEGIEIVPTCYLFKFRKKNEECWRRVYILVVSPRNIDYELKTE